MLMTLAIFSEGQELISASRAAEKVDYASDYIGQLCRAKKIPGKLIGKTWYVDFQQLLEYKKSRKAGKKGQTLGIQKGLTLSFSAVPDDAPFLLLPPLSKHVPAPEKKIRSPYAFTKSAALALSLIVAISIGLSALEKTSPTTASQIAASTNLAAASIFDFFTDGWNGLKDLALGTSPANATINPYSRLSG